MSWITNANYYGTTIVNDHESTFRDTLEIEVDMCFSDQINVFVILVTVLKEDGRKHLMPDYLDGEIRQLWNIEIQE